ncbi:MAG TPA: DUF721 domain-containing protein [Pyrinomonadaceae bacterium]|nr:DUF721 domain-containing protein [Pyrinomonadaceae bacterium]
MYSNEISPFREILLNLAEIFEKDEEAANAFVKGIWPSIVGKELALNSKPINLLDGRLEVAVRDEFWLKNLKSLAPVIIGKFSRYFKEGSVTYIEFIENGEEFNADGDLGRRKGEPGIEKANLLVKPTSDISQNDFEDDIDGSESSPTNIDGDKIKNSNLKRIFSEASRAVSDWRDRREKSGR